MIRPFTLICAVLAGGSGLYLYQCKHQAQVLDRDIAKTVKQTEAVRERIGMLRGEWTMLNDPERLGELARAHTALQTLQPAQFTALADLAGKLPPPGNPGRERPGETDPEETPVAQLASPAPVPAAALPVSQPSPPRPVQTAIAIAPEPKVEPKPVVAEAKPAPTRHAPPRPPAQLAAAAVPHVQAPVLQAEVTNAAVAPGTIGAAVLRSMRANGYAPAQTAPAYVQPAYAPSVPSYPQASYPQASYAPASSVSLLGASGRAALPPPVPFVSR